MGSAPTVADFFLYEGLACYGEMLGMDRLKELAPALVRPPTSLMSM